jgi:DNA-binding GntR family transcriptional regulator
MKRDSMTEIETSTEEDAGALQLPSFHQQSSLREQVADALRAHLVSGRMRPGVLYSAPKLAAEFGVSATPVREAMLDLVSEGLVDVVRNKGFRVTHLSDAELDAMAELRALIEVPVMGMIAESCEGERIPAVKALRKVADAITDAAARKDLVAYIELDTEFHLRFLELHGNAHIVAVIRDLRRRSRLYGLEDLVWHRPHAATVRGAPADGRCRPGAGRRDDENPHGTTHWPRPVGLGRPRRRAVTLRLTPVEQAMLDGSEGEGVALAMRIVTGLARVRGAEELVDVTGAHIDSCLYHGRAGLDFAEKLVDLGARVRVPTTLNVGSLDLLHPGTVRADAEHPELLTAGRALMDAYVALGARTTFTCAPYQVDARPAVGEHVAWAESNAIVFANSVLGARTDRYGDFLDISAAITGRAPRAGFHLDEARRADFVLDVTAVAPERWHDEAWYAVLGYLLGRQARSRVAAIVGLPATTSEDDLKALGAAAASSGGVGIFHAVGVTPEAPMLESVLAHSDPRRSQALGRRPGSGSTRALHRRRGSDRRREPGHATRVAGRDPCVDRGGGADPHHRGHGRHGIPLDGARRACPGRGSGPDRTARACRLPDRRRHLHLPRPDPARRHQGGHDELRQMGALCARQPRDRRRDRHARRVRAGRRGRSGGPG